ncbi:MAG: Na/Pi symporter [Verrucomicrobiia bacterium]|jgi:sodium-dependent phosphate cotransporter
MNRDRLILFAKLLGILACLYFFIVGINGMSHSFKLFGKAFADSMLKTTASPFVGLFIGILATALVQSSSTTTSIIVGMVAGGAITIEGAIPMVMGANIGTTITNLLVSLGHITQGQEFRRAFAAATVHDVFNWITVLVLFPLELATGMLAKVARILAGWFTGVGGMKLGNPLKASTKKVVGFISDLFNDQPIIVLLVSVFITFGMLYLIVKLLRSLVLEKVEHLFSQHLFRNAGRAMFFGFVLTVAVQSSSITTSLVIPLAGAGILRLVQILPYTLGANVGTTMTAILAALATGNKAAITVAFAHLMFNLLGIALIWPIERVRMIPVRIAEWLASLSQKNRAIPIVLILVIFFALPLTFIFLLK